MGRSVENPYAYLRPHPVGMPHAGRVFKRLYFFLLIFASKNTYYQRSVPAGLAGSRAIA
jgi:hypothetical protein